ncbi:precorrin-6A synthase (deacetylating) [Sphingobium indicum]|uniref:Precorrin-6A synthase [deacetylating] n=2 Tax=Sphingobium indicum TaxID=332055 RepID=A0A1L5BQI3_SPHIB|nr:precorrin-6A synthase (deacetylating) [Sphingobium indicum]APL95133.1 precorrin 6A synthase [Sphingobium indicum B90A]KEY99093.1 precorrin 6A synthase [Sphingomonas sp. BHC-A]NYI23492.1 precorrin-6A synthase [Sphingobium indicum]RYM01642.1 precorrin-6A synthase (deacetylating) [Sphingobium indicum]
MIGIDLIGIGTGNPDHLTRAAAKAMNDADLILLPRKGAAKSDLVDLRRAICAELLTQAVKIVEFDMPRRADRPDYVGAVLDWHDAIAALWMEQIARHLPNGGRLALLVWGDPSLYDSSLRIAGRLPGVKVRVIPGITSIQALTAAHGICLNDLAEPVLITTGRRLAERGWPDCADTLAVMLDGHCAFQAATAEGIDIWWGAYLGLPQESIMRGALTEVGADIVRRRAALRKEHGWIMDIYLLRRQRPG